MSLINMNQPPPTGTVGPPSSMQRSRQNGQPVSPQSQQVAQGEEIYKIIASQMISTLYDSKEDVLNTLKMGGEQESATVLARMMVMMLNSLKMAGKRVEPGIMLLAMTELARALGELAIGAGLMTDDPHMIEESFFAAIAKADDELQKEALGEQDRQQYAVFMQQMRQIQQKHMQPQAQSQPQQPQPRTEQLVQPGQAMPGGRP